MKIRGRYVAQVIIDIDMDNITHNNALSEMRKNVTETWTPGLKTMIEDDLTSPGARYEVEVIQQYADVHEVTEDQEE